MKKITKIFLGIVVIFIAVFFFNTTFAQAAGKSFNAHLKIIKNMLNKGQYNALTNKYLTKIVKVGAYRSEYDLLSRNFVKNHYLKPNSFKVIYKTQMTERQWNEHFTEITALQRGMVVAKVLDKQTKEAYKDIDGNTLIYIFQVTKQKGPSTSPFGKLETSLGTGKVKIPGILNSTLNIIESLNLIP